MKSQSENWYDGIEDIISEPLRFKAKLAIGDEAYTSLRVKKNAKDIIESAIVGGAGASAIILSSATTISILSFSATFITGGLLLPILIGAGAGSVWYGTKRLSRKVEDAKVIKIPEFINTPLDLLALTLFNFTAPLALKLSQSDENISENELNLINAYYHHDWGYDTEFLKAGLEFIETNLDDISVEELANQLVEHKKKNPDCNYDVMKEDLFKFLYEVSIADGHIDSREEATIELIRKVFTEADKTSLRKISEKTLADVKGIFT